MPETGPLKLLVIGCDGMLGHVAALYMQERGHHVTGVDDAFLQEHGVGDALRAVVRGGDFDAVMNCAAVINQDAEADPARAVEINALLPHALAAWTRDTRTRVVNRGTDCIFSGRRGQYTPDDVPDGASFYARSKALGEVVNSKDLTLRTSLIGPETDAQGVGLFNWFTRQTGDVGGYANAIWTGITTIAYARAAETLLLSGAHGLLQLVPDAAISKYRLLCLFAQAFPGGRRVVRVENARVDKSLVQSLGGWEIAVPSYQEMVFEMKDWIAAHDSIYPHYTCAGNGA